MTDTSMPNPGIAALIAFEKAYAEAAGGGASTQPITFLDPALRAGLKAVVQPYMERSGLLGSELSSWIGLLQNLGYAGEPARDRFNKALELALQASFEVARPMLDLALALDPPTPPPPAPAQGI
jgi:hypothetical protein